MHACGLPVVFVRRSAEPALKVCPSLPCSVHAEGRECSCGCAVVLQPRLKFRIRMFAMLLFRNARSCKFEICGRSFKIAGVHFASDRGFFGKPSCVAMAHAKMEDADAASDAPVDGVTTKGRLVEKPMKYFLTVHWHQIIRAVVPYNCVCMYMYVSNICGAPTCGA